MSRQVGSLNHSFSYSSNLQRHDSLISISDLTSSPYPVFTSNSPRKDLDESTETVFNTNSNFNNSNVGTSDKILESEPSPTKFSQPRFSP